MINITATIFVSVALIVLSTGVESRADPMGTAFTYQGHLKESGLPVTDLARDGARVDFYGQMDGNLIHPKRIAEVI